MRAPNLVVFLHFCIYLSRYEAASTMDHVKESLTAWYSALFSIQTIPNQTPPQFCTPGMVDQSCSWMGSVLQMEANASVLILNTAFQLIDV
jgi:hypothetical protein